MWVCLVGVYIHMCVMALSGGCVYLRVSCLCLVGVAIYMCVVGVAIYMCVVGVAIYMCGHDGCV